MSGSSISFDRALGLTTIGALVFGSFLIALPSLAAEDIVTGYETGYQYRQGLAIGAGGQLMAANATNDTVTQNSTGSVLGTSNDTAVVAQNAPFVPSVQESAVVDPTPETAPVVMPVETESAFSMSSFFAPALLALVVALLALLGLAIWAVTGPVDREVSRTRRHTYRY